MAFDIRTEEIPHNYLLDTEKYKIDFQNLTNQIPTPYTQINPLANRYNDIYPFENNRITVGPKQEYINASPIILGDTTFIAAQAPTTEPTNIVLFWTMIFEQDVDVLVNLTDFHSTNRCGNIIEKSIKYWPDHLNSCNNTFIFDNITVQTNTDSTIEFYDKKLSIQKIILSTETHKKQIYFIHYTGWGDHRQPFSTIQFSHILHLTHLHHSPNKKILVHCSAGIGRTGTFISIYHLLQIIPISSTDIIFQTVNNIRKQRATMVQTFS